jgi:hypothetical protein
LDNACPAAFGTSWTLCPDRTMMCCNPEFDALIARGFAHQFRQAPHERKGCFLPGALRDAREAHHVGERTVSRQNSSKGLR